MENQVLSIDQMKHLQELGLDTSKTSMCWVIDCNHARHLKIHDLFAYKATDEKVIPTFTLQDILELLPSCIKEEDDYFLLIEQLSYDKEKDWNIRYISFDDSLIKKQFASLNLLDAAYEMLCWCIENGHIKSK